MMQALGCRSTCRVWPRGVPRCYPRCVNRRVVAPQAPAGIRPHLTIWPLFKATQATPPMQTPPDGPHEGPGPSLHLPRYLPTAVTSIAQKLKKFPPAAAQNLTYGGGGWREHLAPKCSRLLEARFEKYVNMLIANGVSVKGEMMPKKWKRVGNLILWGLLRQTSE